jgi:hypothetical protein
MLLAMIRRIWNLTVRTIASHLPPCGVKSRLYGWSGILVGRRVHISPGVYVADGYRSGLVRLEDGAVTATLKIRRFRVWELHGALLRDFLARNGEDAAAGPA